MLVVDASVVAVGLIDDGPDGDLVRARLRGERLVAPALLDLEVLSVWRGLALGGRLDPRRARLAIDDLADLPVRRVDPAAVLWRCWELRSNLTVYDAAYVAVAEALDATLVTGDRRIARASGPRCPVEVLQVSN